MNDNDDGKVVRLVPKSKAQEKAEAAETNAEVIELLEETLEDARAGKIIEIAVAEVHSDGAVSTGHTSTNNLMRLLAAVSRMQHRLHIRADIASGG